MCDFFKWLIPYVISVGLAFATGHLVHAEPLAIVGPKVAAPHQLVRLSPNKDVSGGAVEWSVTPDDKGEWVELPDGGIVFTGKVGDYRASLRVYRIQDGKVRLETARWSFSLKDASAAPPGGGKAASMVPDCIARLSVGRSGCTCTAVWPRRSDGRWDVLTASHCTGGIGSKGVMTLKDGREIRLTVTQRQTTADLTWFATDEPVESLPYAVLATADPEPGVPVWQAGYGVSQPTVRKDGVVTGRTEDGKLSFRLLADHGDSGGPIFRSDSAELVAVVCCSAQPGVKTEMHGGSATIAARLRPVAMIGTPETDGPAEHRQCHPLPLRMFSGKMLLPDMLPL